jgi:hypothetical protein
VTVPGRCRRRMGVLFASPIQVCATSLSARLAADTGISSNTATPVAPHPALRATFSPLAGRRNEHVPRLRGEGKSVLPANGEKERLAPRLRGKEGQAELAP